MPKTIFIEAKWTGKISLGKDVIDHFKRNSVTSIALFASVQFLELSEVRRQLEEEGFNIITTKAKRTHAETQVLGCDAYHDSFDKDIFGDAEGFLYIGDGLFHPKALLLAQRETGNIREVVIWDPVSEKMRVIDEGTVKAQVSKTKANLKRFISAETIGVLVTVKPGQQYLEAAKQLKSHLEAQGKKVYIFMDDMLKIDQFENYPFIDAWVNTACPRIGLDDHVHASKPLINSREAMDPISALEKLDK